MPELPEVETIKTAIEKAIGYSNIIHVKVNNNKLREEIPTNFCQDITGAKIIKYNRIAKYMVIDLDNGLSIIWHLGMTGKVKISKEIPKEIGKHDHVIITTDNGVLVYNDVRRFGLITITETKLLPSHKRLARIGLDPFDENLNESYLKEKFKNKKVAIKVALLDQSIINGLGNIYVSEALFLAKISPLRPSCELTKDERILLIKTITDVLTQAIKAGGSTLKDYAKPDGSLGYFQNLHCVYNKNGQRCLNCTCDIDKTGGIQKITQAGRSTFYCATKQK